MKPREAIQRIKALSETFEEVPSGAVKEAIDALEKQISKSPIQNQEDGEWECPNCESYLEGVYEYCPACGQRLMNDDKPFGSV